MLSLIGWRRPLIPLLLLLAFGFPASAFGLNFNAYWLYRERGAEGAQTRREFQQVYNTGATPTLTYHPTNAISARFFLKYSRVEINQGNDRGWVSADRLTPTADITLSNDIFSAQLGGYVTKTFHSGTTGVPTTTNWQASLSSAWQIPLWPSLTLNYGEMTNEVSGGTGSNASGTKEKSAGISVNWDLLLAKLYYQFTHNESEDRSSGSVRTADTHFARVDTDGSFWQKRVHFNLGQQALFSTQDLSLGNTQDGYFDEKLVPRSLSSALTDPNQLPDPPPGGWWTDQEVGLSPNPILGNGILDDNPALDVPPEGNPNDRRVHLGVSFDSAQQIDLVDIYLDPLTNLTGDQASTLQWDLYVRNPFGTGWELAAANLPTTFNADKKRFEVTINRRDTQIMVVSVMPDGISLAITEVEAYSRLTQDNSSTRTFNYQGDLGMSIRIARNLRASTQVSFQRFNTKTGGSDYNTQRLSTSATLGWTPTPLFSPSIAFSQNRQDQTDQEDLKNRSYSLIVTTLPLPTLNLSLGATRTERYTGGTKTQTSDNYSLTTAAKIYPDLNAALNLDYRTAKITDTDGAMVGSNSYGARMALNAIINPQVTSNLTTDYSRTERNTDTGGTITSSRSTFSLLYRPSDLLVGTLTGTKSWTGTGDSDSLILDLNLWLLRTPKTRLNFRYTHVQANLSSDSFRLDWSWNISRALYWQNKFHFANGQGYNYSIESLLTLRL